MSAQAETDTEQSRLLRHIRFAAVGILFAVSVAGAYFARDFLLPVVFALFIAITLRPSVRALARWGIPAWATTTVIVITATIVLLAATYVFTGAIMQWMENAETIRNSLLEKLGGLRASLDRLSNIGETLQDVAVPTDEPGVQEVVVRQSMLPTVFGFIASYPLSIFIAASGAIVIAVFLMASGDLFYEKLIKVLPTLSDKKAALSIALDIEREVSAYLLSTTLINAALATAVGLSFWAIGMPTPHLWALFAFILNFIPYIGPITGLLASALISLVTFSTLGQILLAPLVYGLLIGLETQIITPYVLSRRMQINAVMILLALAFWAWLWGIAGIVVAVPMLVTFRVLCSHVPALALYGEFMAQRGDSPARAATTEQQQPGEAAFPEATGPFPSGRSSPGGGTGVSPATNSRR